MTTTLEALIQTIPFPELLAMLDDALPTEERAVVESRLIQLAEGEPYEDQT